MITALEQTLHLDQGALDHERAVLSRYGNMSAPTVLFVLERLVAAGPAQAHGPDGAGPGLHLRLLSLARAA